MAYIRQSRTPMSDAIGQTVRSGIEMFQTAKGLYDLGRNLYTGYQAISQNLATGTTALIALY